VPFAEGWAQTNPAIRRSQILTNLPTFIVSVDVNGGRRTETEENGHAMPPFELHVVFHGQAAHGLSSCGGIAIQKAK
jgi:hypothetical protein